MYITDHLLLSDFGRRLSTWTFGCAVQTRKRTLRRCHWHASLSLAVVFLAHRLPLIAYSILALSSRTPYEARILLLVYSTVSRPESLLNQQSLHHVRFNVRAHQENVIHHGTLQTTTEHSVALCSKIQPIDAGNETTARTFCGCLQVMK
jgi:hypothetical protein